MNETTRTRGRRRAQAGIVLIGAGQAGLATSFELTRLGLEHVILERDRVGATWRGRWDSFCLVTPNWTVQLPGAAYDGPDQDGYLLRDEIVAYLERYAAGFGAPVREGVSVTALDPAPSGGFVLATSDGEIRADAVVVATGAYQRPYRPAVASTLPDDLLQLDVEDFRSDAELPAGKVLIVGSGQSGCQIAEELHQAGRDVYLSAGRAPWAPRRIGGRDLVWWLIQSGFMEQPLSALPSPAARLVSNPLTSGHDGGHDLHLRTLRRDGITLLGRFLGADGRRAHFARDLGATMEWSDARYRELMGLVEKVCRERGLRLPSIEEPQPFRDEFPEEVDLADVGTVLFCTGFRPDYERWVHLADAFDEFGFPQTLNGTSLAHPGLHFVGVHFLRKRKSGLLYGVGEDAGVVAKAIAADVRTARSA